MDFFRHVLPIDGEYQPRPKAKIRIFFFVPASFRSSVVRQFESNGSRAQLGLLLGVVTQSSTTVCGLDFLGHPHPFCCEFQPCGLLAFVLRFFCLRSAFLRLFSVMIGAAVSH